MAPRTSRIRVVEGEGMLATDTCCAVVGLDGAIGVLFLDELPEFGMRASRFYVNLSKITS
jgi:hypothetical protein